MKRRILAIVATATPLLIWTAQAPVFAAELMTCASFRQKLPEKIHDGGDLVAMPTDFHVGFKSDNGPHVRYDFGGIVGLEGSLDCYENDVFDSIKVEAKISTDDGTENLQRINRAMALGAAALCVVEQITATDARSTLRKLADKAIYEFYAAKKRGQPWPAGSAGQDFSSGSKVLVQVVPGSFAINVDAPPP